MLPIQPISPPPLTPQQQAIWGAASINIRDYPAVNHEGNGTIFLQNHPDLWQKMLDRNSTSDADIHQVYVDWVKSKGFDKNVASIPIAAPNIAPAPAAPPAPPAAPAPQVTAAQLDTWKTGYKADFGKDPDAAGVKFYSDMVASGKWDQAAYVKFFTVTQGLQPIRALAGYTGPLKKVEAPEQQLDRLLEARSPGLAQQLKSRELDTYNILKNYAAQGFTDDQLVKLMDNMKLAATNLRAPVTPVTPATPVVPIIQVTQKQLDDWKVAYRADFGRDPDDAGVKFYSDMVAIGKWDQAAYVKFLTVTEGLQPIRALSGYTGPLKKVEAPEQQLDRLLEARSPGLAQQLKSRELDTYNILKNDAAQGFTDDQLVKLMDNMKLSAANLRAPVVPVAPVTPAIQVTQQQIDDWKVGFQADFGVAASAAEVKYFSDMVASGKWDQTQYVAFMTKTQKHVPVRSIVGYSGPISMDLQSFKSAFHVDFGVDPSADEIKFYTDMKASGKWDQAAYFKYMIETKGHQLVRPAAKTVTSAPGFLDYLLYGFNEIAKDFQYVATRVPDLIVGVFTGPQAADAIFAPRNLPGYTPDPRIAQQISDLKLASNNLAKDHPELAQLLEIVSSILSATHKSEVSQDFSGPATNNQGDADQGAQAAQGAQGAGTPPPIYGWDSIAAMLDQIVPPDDLDDTKQGGFVDGVSQIAWIPKFSVGVQRTINSLTDLTNFTTAGENWLNKLASTIDLVDNMYNSLGIPVNLTKYSGPIGIGAALWDLKHDLAKIKEAPDKYALALIGRDILTHVAAGAASRAAWSGNEYAATVLTALALALMCSNKDTRQEAIAQLKDLQTQVSPYTSSLWDQVKFFCNTIIPLQADAVAKGQGTKAVQSQIDKLWKQHQANRTPTS